MHARIYAESLENYSTGKTSRVYADLGGIDMQVTPDHTEIHVKASFRDRTTSGERGGNYNPVTRRLLVALTKSEMLALIGAAVEQKLLDERDIPAAAGLDEQKRLVASLQASLESTTQELQRLQCILDDVAALVASRPTTPSPN